MGLFNKGGGGIMDVIRCDLDNYIVWKWHPQGNPSGSHQNAIRYGSSLRVKQGEVAVFFYKQNNGIEQDFIIGPYDGFIKTDNFPILASLVGLAYGGESPFQAEVYFINLQKNNQISFGIPYFDIFDSRLPDFGVPVSVRGKITFSLDDYRRFVSLNRLQDFSLQQFGEQINAALSRKIKQIVSHYPELRNIPVFQVSRDTDTLSDYVSDALRSALDEFGVSMRRIDIESISFDTESEEYQRVFRLTAGNTERTMQMQVEMNLRNLEEMQAINSENMKETMRIQREEAQRAQRLQSESTFINAHRANLQAEVLGKAAESLGQLGGGGLGSGGDISGGGGIAGAMTGMMMGGALGGQMAGMINQMGQAFNANAGASATPVPPPITQTAFFVAQGDSPTGPFSIPDLQTLLAAGEFSPESLVWKEGMAQWAKASDVAELASLFARQNTATPPPIPPNI